MIWVKDQITPNTGNEAKPKLWPLGRGRKKFWYRGQVRQNVGLKAEAGKSKQKPMLRGRGQRFDL